MDLGVWIGLFTLMGGMALIIDTIISEERIGNIKNELAAWGLTLNQLSFNEILNRILFFFNELFNEIYGKKHFSKKTFIRSCLSSAFFLTFTIAVCSVIRPKFIVELKSVSNDILFICIINLFVDYFSLIETRIVLSWSKGKILIVHIAAILFDLLISLVIYLLGISIFMAYKESLSYFFVVKELLASIPEITHLFTFVKVETPFFYSTLFTSFLFYLFFISAALTRFLLTLNVPIGAILNWLANSKNPIKVFVGVFAGMVLILDGLNKLLT